MSDPTTDVILATGGVAVVRAAYRSGNPAIGVGPGNVPALVDHTADLAPGRKAAGRLEGVRQLDPVHQRVVRDRRGAMRRRVRARAGQERRARAGRRARPCGARRPLPGGPDADRPDRPRRHLLAAEGGIKVPPTTRVLVAPFPLVVPEEPLAREKLFPLLGLVRVPDAGRGIEAARAMLRIGGAGHSAVIHSPRPGTIMAYGVAVRVLRVAVNVGGSTGSGRSRHQPGADHDDRHRLLRSLVARREPGAAPPDQHGSGWPTTATRRAVRRLHRPRAVERARPSRRWRRPTPAARCRCWRWPARRSGA